MLPSRAEIIYGARGIEGVRVDGGLGWEFSL